MTELNECFCTRGSRPHALLSPWLSVTSKFKDSVLCVSQPIRDESDDIMSGWVQYLMQAIITPPQSVCLLSLHNLLWNMGSITVKAVPCLIWTNRQGPVAFSTIGLFGTSGGVPLLASPRKNLSLTCDVRRGRLDSMKNTSTPGIRNFSGCCAPVPTMLPSVCQHPFECTHS